MKTLLAPSRPDQASAVSAELIRDAYSLLRQSNDFVIVDTPPGFTSEVIASIDASTDLIMVGMLDSLSLKNTKLGLETLSLMGYDQSQVRLVLNRAHSRVGISVSDVISVLGREPDVYVPSDREIPRAVNEGEPIVLSKPDSEAAAAFRSLAALYAGATYEAPALAAAGARPKHAPAAIRKEKARHGTPRAPERRPARRHTGSRRAVRRAEEHGPPAGDRRPRARSSSTSPSTTRR